MAARLTAAQKKRIQVVLPEQAFASIAALEARTPTAAGTKTEIPEAKELLTAKEVEALIRR